MSEWPKKRTEIYRNVLPRDTEIYAGDNNLRALDEIERLQTELDRANNDAAALADELVRLLGEKQPIVWEEVGEDNPALIAHRMRIESGKNE